ncbi:hypothetical protein Vadar_033188 [Vaccinium darrowii]|uniref:Uncharacterized protein n=1 Tax=Vaccinium darrowii TaxID=229202 RepID=A0ACB7Z7S3_9ERIC|nr:hypothetical protein Vadar_033188 [Vaccinium darrowii]
MRLEPDGHLKVYKWAGAEWNTLADFLASGIDDCGCPTACGKYGIGNYDTWSRSFGDDESRCVLSTRLFYQKAFYVCVGYSVDVGNNLDYNFTNLAVPRTIAAAAGHLEGVISSGTPPLPSNLLGLR